MNKQEEESVGRAKAVLNSIYGQRNTIDNTTEESDIIKECFRACLESYLKIS